MPDSRDLCTLADVRALMQKKDSDTAQDALIQAFITRASVKIMRDTGRELIPGGPDAIDAVAATRTFSYPWSDQYEGEAFVSLAPYDLRVSTAPTVVVDSDQSAPLTISTDEYRFWPQPPESGVYLALKVQPYGFAAGPLGWRKREIKVTGDWGFPSVPFEVTQAAAETVAYWVTAHPGAHRMDPDSGLMATAPRGLPLTALDLLSAFRRMTV